MRRIWKEGQGNVVVFQGIIWLISRKLYLFLETTHCYWESLDWESCLHVCGLLSECLERERERGRGRGWGGRQRGEGEGKRRGREGEKEEEEVGEGEGEGEKSSNSKKGKYAKMVNPSEEYMTFIFTVLVTILKI